MYSENKMSGSVRLCLQRILCSSRCVMTIIIIFLFSIFLYYYNESISSLKTQEIQGNQCQQKLDSVSAQLQVVYEHKTRLEKSQTADKESFDKKIEEMKKELRLARVDNDKSMFEVADLKTQLVSALEGKQAADQAVSKANLNIENAKDVYTKEIEALKTENANLKAQLIQLQTALNRSHGNTISLQQKLDQQLNNVQQQRQHEHPAPAPAAAGQQHQPIPVANQQAAPVSKDQAAAGANDQALPAPPMDVQSPARANGVAPPKSQTSVPVPHAEQVALPMAEGQQQQLIAQRELPQKQQQDEPAGGAGPPVLQHPLGEDQQQKMMIKPNNPPHDAQSPQAAMAAPAQAPPQPDSAVVMEQKNDSGPLPEAAVPAPAASIQEM